MKRILTGALVVAVLGIFTGGVQLVHALTISQEGITRSTIGDIQSQIKKIEDNLRIREAVIDGRRAEFRADTVVVKRKGDTHFSRVTLGSNDTVEGVLARLRSTQDVIYAEPDYIAYAFTNDPLYNLQWHMRGSINVEEAWDTTRGEGIIVAIIDSGIAYENYGSRYDIAPDLTETCFVPGYNFVRNTTHANDDNSHGTHVAGTVAQSTNNGTGVAGVAYESCLMPVKVLNRYGSGSYSDIAEAVIWATDNGAHIINMSLGGSSGTSYLRDAMQYAYDNGVTIIAAAGNNGSNSISYPARYDDYVIAVGATRYDDARASYSNYGSSLDIMAPGGDLDVDQNGDGYGDGVLQNTFNPNTRNEDDFGYWFFDGTSMAAPHVAGVAALVMANGNATTPDEVRMALQESATDLGVSGRDNFYGWGLVNAAAALSWNGGSTPPPPEPPPPPPPEENIAPTAVAGSNQVAEVNDTVNFNGTNSSDPDGSITGYEWDFDDGTSASSATPTHTYTSAGAYTVTLTVTDNDGATDNDTLTVTVNNTPEPPPPPPPSGDTVVFEDSFENGEWDEKWKEDSQRDWKDSRRNSLEGRHSAEVDGGANDATLTSLVIDLEGRTNAHIEFSWFIEDKFDNGEYLAFDYSTDGGASWTEYKRLRGETASDTEQWITEQLELSGINILKLRFRATISSSTEDGYVDAVTVTAY